MPNAAQMATQFVPAIAGAAEVCANTAGLAIKIVASAPTVTITFFIVFSLWMNRQAVVAGSSHFNRPHFGTALQV
jgi:hypothetical protein